MMSPREQREREVEAGRRLHLSRGRLEWSTNFGHFRLQASDTAQRSGDDGLPEWETELLIATGPTHMSGRLDDRALLAVADAIYRWLERPVPPVRLEVMIAPPAPVRRRRAPK